MQISRLYSLITMCAWSKRVQFGDKWVPLEEYMRKRFGLRISHGISQEEYAKWAMSEMDEALTPEQPAAASSPLPAETHAPKAAV